VPLPETDLTARIRRQARKARAKALVAGIGDDSAVLRLPERHDLLVTTDFSIEGVHFRREWHPADSVGHRCLVRGLSDIAAMGGTPVAAFLSLAVPADLPQDWIDDFVNGLLELAARFKLPLAGGDTSESPGAVTADIIVTGAVPRGTALLRSGARPGDSIYVTGELGASAGVLHALMRGEQIAPNAKAARRHFYPEPRLALGEWLRDRKLASACIDLSDGLSTDLGHLCDESAVGALIYEHSLPRAPLPEALRFGASALHFALHGGEDYELLLTAAPKAKIPERIAKVPVRRIGEVIADKNHRAWLVDSHSQRKPLGRGGWEHFRE
jgi:thiamine-monophosphate kinase